MFKHKSDWIVLFIIGVFLFVLYGFDLREMFKRILEWGLALTGFKLLFDYGLIQKMNQILDKKD